MLCGSLVGGFLPVQLIYKGKTNRHPKFNFSPEWDITHLSKHWSNEKTIYVENIIIPFVEQTRESLGEDNAAVVIMDNFKGQVTAAIISEDEKLVKCLSCELKISRGGKKQEHMELPTSRFI